MPKVLSSSYHHNNNTITLSVHSCNFLQINNQPKHILFYDNIALLVQDDSVWLAHP